MKVLITGAGGSLGRVLAPVLVKRGHEPVLFDNRPIETPYPFQLGDVTNKDDVLEVMQGVDAVVHGAALHGIHLAKYAADDFWNLNVTGTHHIYEAARTHGVKKVLLCSTMGVYGESVVPQADGVAVVTEALPLKPTDIYGLSKKLCEELAEFYSRRHGVQTIAYRLGMFVPEDFVRYGFRLLKGGVDDRDVAQAFLLGLENEVIRFDAFNIMAEVPFTPEEFARLKREPKTVLEERYPGVTRLVASRGLDLDEIVEMWGFTYWSIEKAKLELGYQPEHNFSEFYAALQEGDEGYYPFANLPWWGA
jgi:UDP-glucose 4-epimerase